MFAAEHIAYELTGSFTKIVTDYLAGAEPLRRFYAQAPDAAGIGEAMKRRSSFQTNRTVLAEAFRRQYSEIGDEKSSSQIDALLDPSCFTICTAHQPNLATGPLYFVYKILHAIKLADSLRQAHPKNNFVPVFYMGSEDADLDELDHFSIAGKTYRWDTKQTGAVGKMLVDKNLINLIRELESQVGIHPFGKEWTNILLDSFQEGRSIQEATFQLVHSLFGSYGLLVLIADVPELKALMQPVFEEDLFQHRPASIVEGTCEKLAKHYGVQANPRPVNLFYLKDQLRERIERSKDKFIVCNTDISFTDSEIKAELEKHPERFSPNVILRGIYQETILPNVAFIGGGGELAYWLQLKDMFDHYQVPFPPLVLRNSFLVITPEDRQRINKLGLNSIDLFQPARQLIDRFLEQEGKKPGLNGALEDLKQLYAGIKVNAAAADPTLASHVAALQKQAEIKLDALTKKMIRAAHKKEEARHRQIAALRERLFPGEGLQERKENLGGFYARYGSAFIDALLEHSPALDAAFTVLEVKGS